MRQVKGGRGPCSEGIACRCNFSFHKWKNCSIDFSHIILLFIVVKKKSIKEKLSFNLSGEGVFMQPAKVCYIILDSRRLFSWDTMASWSLSEAPAWRAALTCGAELGLLARGGSGGLTPMPEGPSVSVSQPRQTSLPSLSLFQDCSSPSSKLLFILQDPSGSGSNVPFLC